MVEVPDARLNELAKIVEPKRIMHSQVEFVDIAGLVKGASKGEGLGNKFLANIRECEVLLHIVRCFDDSNITHVEGHPNPSSQFKALAKRRAIEVFPVPLGPQKRYAWAIFLLTKAFFKV